MKQQDIDILPSWWEQNYTLDMLEEEEEKLLNLKRRRQKAS